MPTLPYERDPEPEPEPEPEPHSDFEPHAHRQVAESFGSDAARYDRSRPEYPQAMVDRIVAASTGTDFLDVGCGTGIAARQFEATGCRVLGIDVDVRMAEVARRNGLQVEVSRFEEWEPAGWAFDTVVSGQTWHWVDPVAGAAKAADALRPGGRLAVFWNVFQPSTDVSGAFAEVYRRVAHDLPFKPWSTPSLDVYSAILDKTTDGIRKVGRYAEPERLRFDWERYYTRDDWLEQLPTHGGHTQLPGAQLEELKAGIGESIDALGGGFTMGYAAIVVTAARPFQIDRGLTRGLGARDGLAG